MSRLGQQPGGCLDQRIGGAGAIQRPAAEVARARKRRRDDGLAQQIGGQEQNGRSRPTAACGNECLIDIVFDPVRSTDSPDPLCAAREQCKVIEFLKRVAIGLRAFDFLDQCDDRNACLHCFGDLRV